MPVDQLLKRSGCSGLSQSTQQFSTLQKKEYQNHNFLGSSGEDSVGTQLCNEHVRAEKFICFCRGVYCFVCLSNRSVAWLEQGLWGNL